MNGNALQPEDAAFVVRQCAELRERQAQTPMTIQTAIERAQAWRSQPDLVVDTFTAKTVADTLLAALEHDPCFFKATLRGEQTFVLVERDRAAPPTIGQWAAIAAAHGCPDEKIQEALAKAERWRNTPRIPTKWPD